MKILTLAKFYKVTELDNLESLMELDNNNSFDWGEMIVDTLTIVSANETEEGLTTIELPSGLRQTLGIRWNEYKKLLKDFDTIMDAKCKYEYQEQE